MIDHVSPRPELLGQERIQWSEAMRVRALLLDVVREDTSDCCNPEPVLTEVKNDLFRHFLMLHRLLRECKSVLDGLPHLDFDDAESWYSLPDLLSFPILNFVDNRTHVDVSSSLLVLRSCRLIPEEELALQHIQVLFSGTVNLVSPCVVCPS